MVKQNVMKTMKKLIVISFVMLFLSSNLFPYAKAEASTYDTNTADSGQVISIGDNVSGSITETDDYHYYKINLSTAGCFSFTFTSYMEYYQVIVYDEMGNQIWYTDNNEYNPTVKFRTDSYSLDLKSGNYYMRVAGYEYGEEYKSTGNYNFSTKFVSADESFTEPNDKALTASNLTIGQKVSGQIALNDDYDYYQLNVTSACKLKINFTSYMKYYQIIIYDSNGKGVWYTDNNEYNSTVGYRSDTHVIDLSAQTYYISVAGYEYGTEYKSTGNYKFTTSLLSVPEKVKLNATSLKYYGCGQTKQLKASLSPSNSSTKLTWSSSDSRIASVNQKGLVTINNYGNAVITVTTDNNCKATCKISVNKVPAPKNFKVKKAGKDAVKMTWSKVSGASGYYIYCTIWGPYSEFSLMKKVGKNTTSYTGRKVANLKYYYKIVAYKIINGREVAGDETSIKSLQ